MKLSNLLFEGGKLIKSIKHVSSSKEDIKTINDLQKTIRYLTNRKPSVLLESHNYNNSDNNSNNNNNINNAISYSANSALGNNSGKNDTSKTQRGQNIEALVSKMNETLPNVENLKKKTIDSHYNFIVDILNIATEKDTNHNRISEYPLEFSQAKSAFNRFIKYCVNANKGAGAEGAAKPMTIHQISKLMNQNFTTDDYYRVIKSIRYFITNQLILGDEKLITEIIIYCYYMVYKKNKAEFLLSEREEDLNELLKIDDYLFNTVHGGNDFLKLNSHIKRLFLILDNALLSSQMSGNSTATNPAIDKMVGMVGGLLSSPSPSPYSFSASSAGGMSNINDINKLIVLTFQVFPHDAIRITSEFNKVYTFQEKLTKEQQIYVNSLTVFNELNDCVLMEEHSHSSAPATISSLKPVKAKIEQYTKQINTIGIQNKILMSNKTSINTERFYFEIGNVFKNLLSDKLSNSVIYKNYKDKKKISDILCSMESTVEKYKIDLILGIM